MNNLEQKILELEAFAYRLIVQREMATRHLAQVEQELHNLKKQAEKENGPSNPIS